MQVVNAWALKMLPLRVQGFESPSCYDVIYFYMLNLALCSSGLRSFSQVHLDMSHPDLVLRNPARGPGSNPGGAKFSIIWLFVIFNPPFHCFIRYTILSSNCRDVTV